jgi:hypothetical protein
MEISHETDIKTVSSRKTGSPLYLYPSAALLMATLIVVIFAALGKLWLGNEIRNSADRTSLLERDLQETRVQLQAMEARIAAYQSPENLKIALAQNNLPLQPPSGNQLILVRERMRTLPADSSRQGETLLAQKPEQPRTRPLNLAFLDAGGGPR